MSLILWSFSGNGLAAPGAKGSGKSQQRVHDFWNGFRDAVRSGSRSAIVRMTNFPFVVRWGNADPNDQSVDYDREKFRAILDRLLALKADDSGDKTMSQVVRDTPRVQDADISSGTFMVDMFEFRQVAGAWRWTAAFTADQFFYPASDSSPIPRISPLRNFILDVTSDAVRLRRPLTVKHLRTTGRVAYLVAQEPGEDGRIVRAFLARQPDDAQGQMVWTIKEYSFEPANGRQDGWSSRIEELVKSGVPPSLFPARPSNQEGRSHGH
jgi:hypothetical protein